MSLISLPCIFKFAYMKKKHGVAHRVVLSIPPLRDGRTDKVNAIYHPLYKWEYNFSGRYYGF